MIFTKTRPPIIDYFKIIFYLQKQFIYLCIKYEYDKNNTSINISNI